MLEEYLQNFKGCVIVVSHDRYFMDKVVDHLLVFNGQADIRDFPGNYSDYRAGRKHVSNRSGKRLLPLPRRRRRRPPVCA